MATTTDPTALNLTLHQGATFERTLTWSYTSAPAGPIDLTGATARLQFRTSHDAATAALTLTEASGLTLGGAAGTIVIDITDSQTAALTTAASGSEAPTYVWDLRVVLSSGDVAIVARGTVLVVPRTTLAS